MAATGQRLCIVVPCYNEAKVVELFYQRLKPVLTGLSDLEHSIVFVDDGSQDDTLARLERIARQDPCVRVLALSRNFGHQVALTAGLDAADADAVLMMDADLQHPPECIPTMVQRWRQGYDVVSAVRQRTADSSLFKRLSSAAFYWLVNHLSDTPIVPGAADFCLLSRQAVQALRQCPERHRFLRGMVSWIGFARATVPFTAPPRPAGRTKYAPARMLALALDAIFSFSIKPIRWATHLGLGAVGLSLVYLAYILYCLLRGVQLVAGWTSIIFVVTFLGGVQLAFIGVLGEYIGRIFEEVKRRPLYLLKATSSAGPADPTPQATAHGR
jgi:dolichol-phosphate mannosyltransferase